MSEKNQSSLSRDYSTTVTILEHLSDALFILNPQGQVEYANRVALDMLGLKLTEILRTQFNNYLNADFDPHMLYDSENPKLLLENIYRGVFSEIETSLIHNEYSTPVEISFGLVRDSSKNVSFIIASAKDITIRKELEKELQQQQLMALSRDRYKELGELAVNMVHSISQPVTSIRLMIEMMEKQFKSGSLDKVKFSRYFTETTKLLDTITSSVAHVRNFAFLTEDESMKSVLVPEIIKSSLIQLDYEIKDRDIEIKVQSEDDLPPVLANPISLQQVINTLLRFLWADNPDKETAVKDNKQQSITIAQQNIKNRWIRISISRLSETELQQKPSEDIEAKPLIGSHLDLTVVQIILTSLGGDFSMYKYENNGEEFILRIPVDKGGERDQLRNLIELLHQ